ncbi:porin family protein [Hymenobacter sp.]|jgi:hypothetical protein|uniref:porin family protein n=1 Tax=Hymenobacter sp. TaxID=1898978 RepID=UPI002EDB9C2A
MIRIATLLLCWLVATMSSARAQRPQVGFKAGLTTSTCSDVPNPENQWGLVAGIFLRQKLGKHLALQPELQYEQRGVRTTQEGRRGFEGSDGLYYRHAQTRLHYLSLPVLVRGQLGKFFALAGPQLGFLAAARQQSTTEYIFFNDRYPRPFPPSESTKSTAPYRRWELGYAVGAGYALSNRLAVEVRYTAGLTDIYKPLYSPYPMFDWRGPDPLVLARNRNWQAQISYQLSSM